MGVDDGFVSEKIKALELAISYAVLGSRNYYEIKKVKLHSKGRKKKEK